MTSAEISDHVYREGLLRLLAVKDSDIRVLTLEQGRDAVDKGIHIGGAFSAVIPLVSLYYGGIIRADVEQPTRVGQDLFVLSKGHAVASMASIYADLGYFDASVLKGSRSADSILNGHPGPLLPGVHISTGPEGHGMPVAQGFALAGRQTPSFDVYCLTGDGEMQAGMIWEATMYAGARHLDNLCVMVDKNEGQLDNPRSLQFPMPHLGPDARVVRMARVRRRRHALRSCSGCAGGVPLRSARRTAHCHRVQHAQGLGRIFQLHGGAQG